MKTAISIPDRVFESSEQVAHDMGISRSELYVTALRSFLEKYDSSKVTEKLNEVYGKHPSRLDPALRTLQSRSLRKPDGKEKW
jgi:hypothetical protein